MVDNNIMDVLDLSEEIKKYISTLYPQDVPFDTRLLPIYRTLLEEQKKQPYSINLVSLIGADENAHSRVLCRLLQYPGEDNTYPLALRFIEKFINSEVAREVATHLGKYKLEIYQEKQRIDLQLFMPGVVGIIIENKINGAEYQQEQLERYIKEMKKRIENPYAIYLTWDGSKKVSDNSLSKQEQHRMHKTGHFIELSYMFKILPWLKDEVLPCCSYKERQLVFALEQYIDYLEIRAACRKQDQSLRQVVYQMFETQFKKGK